MRPPLISPRQCAASGRGRPFPRWLVISGSLGWKPLSRAEEGLRVRQARGGGAEKAEVISAQPLSPHQCPPAPDQAGQRQAFRPTTSPPPAWDGQPAQLRAPPSPAGHRSPTLKGLGHAPLLREAPGRMSARGQVTEVTLKAPPLPGRPPSVPPGGPVQLQAHVGQLPFRVAPQGRGPGVSLLSPNSPSPRPGRSGTQPAKTSLPPSLPPG